METVVTIQIKCNTHRIQFGYYDSDQDNFVVIESTDDAVEAAEKLHCSPDLLAAMATFADIIIANVSADLKAIWKRLDEIETRL